MKAKKKSEKIFRIDFNTFTRKVIEVFEVSPDGSKVRTKEGWVKSRQDEVITQRPPHVPGFMTADQIEQAVRAEQELLREKKFRHTSAYIVAQKYPIKNWLEG